MEIDFAAEGVGGGTPPAIVDIRYCWPSATGGNKTAAKIAAALFWQRKITDVTIRIRISTCVRPCSAGE